MRISRDRFKKCVKGLFSRIPIPAPSNAQSRPGSRAREGLAIRSVLPTSPPTQPLNVFAKKEVEEKKLHSDPNLSKVFAEVVEDFTAGNPQSSEVKWAGLRPSQLQAKLRDHNYKVSFYIINKLLSEAGLSKRSYLKAAILDRVPQRNE